MSNVKKCDNLDNLTKYPTNPDITPSINQGIMFEKYNSKMTNNLEKKNKNKIKEGFGINNNKNKRDIPTENVLATESENIINQNDFSAQSEQLQNLKNKYSEKLNEYKNLMNNINGTSNNYLNRVSNNPYLGKTIRFTTGHICYVTQQGVVKYIGNMEIWDGVDPTHAYVDVNIPFLDSYWGVGNFIPELNLIMGSNVELNQSLTNAGENVFVNRLTTNPKETYAGCYRDKPPATEIMFVPKMNSTNYVSGFYAYSSSVYQKNNTYGPWAAFDQNVNTFWHCEVYNDSTGLGPYDQITGEPKNKDLVQSYTDANGNISNIYGEYLELVVPTNVISGKWGIPLTKYDIQGRQDCCGNPNGRSPNSWVIMGWDGFGWKLIDKQDNQGLNYEMRTYSIANPISCSNYRFVTTNCGNPGDRSGYRYCVQISSWNLYTSSDAYFTDSQRAMTYNPSQIDRVDLETCKNYAAQNGYKYFGMQDGLHEGNSPQCLVSNDLARAKMYGEAFNYKAIPLWDTKTYDNVGNTALINTYGSIVVNNSEGAAIFSTPGPKFADGNYLGCYKDNLPRAMTNISNNQYVSPQECRQLAVDKGLEFYGLQNSHGTDTGWCSGSNDINSVKKYGISQICRHSKGEVFGGPWTNAVYSVNGYGNYFLKLENDGNMCIYKGSSPNDNQGIMWRSDTNGKSQNPNPNFSAAKSKFGKNWIPSGTALAANDFVGSDDGSIYLLMQTDGNLVLYTTEASPACSTNSSGQNIGGGWVNAIYELAPSGFKDNLGKAAYIDENAVLHNYSSNNLKLTTDYTKLEKFDSYGNDIPNAAYGNATIDQCKSSCNNLDDCYGFGFDNQSNVCWPKTSSMYPYGPTRYLPYIDTYTRGKKPIALPEGVSNKISQIDSNQYQYYIDGGAMSDKYGLANATSEQQKQLKVLQNQLNLLSSQINTSTNRYQRGTTNTQNQESKNLKGLDNYTKERYDVENKINGILGNNTLDTQIESFVNNFSVESILKDSDIVVLQKNYEYLFWTILAAASVIIAINIIKKNK
jgi:hypothetical protein